jgi:hypothetical protein
MDVGIEPVALGAQALSTQGLNAHEAAGRTADMEQKLHEKTPPYIFYTKQGVFGRVK